MNTETNDTGPVAEATPLYDAYLAASTKLADVVLEHGFKRLQARTPFAHFTPQGQAHQVAFYANSIAAGIRLYEQMNVVKLEAVAKLNHARQKHNVEAAAKAYSDTLDMFDTLTDDKLATFTPIEVVAGASLAFVTFRKAMQEGVLWLSGDAYLSRASVAALDDAIAERMTAATALSRNERENAIFEKDEKVCACADCLSRIAGRAFLVEAASKEAVDEFDAMFGFSYTKSSRLN